jgi:hypothetical protein
MGSHVSKFQSISVLTFGADNVLFVGDSAGGQIVAIELGSSTSSIIDTAYNVREIDRSIAGFLGVTVDQITVNNLAIHPQTQEAYLAVTRGHGTASIPVILVMTATGHLRELEVEHLNTSSIALSNLPDANLMFWNSIPARNLTITDLEYANGDLYVTGLSNAEFTSTLYRIPYPFANTYQVSSVEIYHAVHNQNETRAPIRTFSIVNLEGQPHILAAYTCTPLVTIPVSELEQGAHVKGKTIAELGFGNTPIDMLKFSAPGANGLEEYVLIINKARDGMVLRLQDIVAAQAQAGLSTPVQVPQQITAGVPFVSVPLTGILHIDNQGDQFFLAVRRDLETGHLELISIRKGFYFRLSDFINEYDFPGYSYPDDPFQQNYIRKAHEILKADEGFAALVK